MGIAKRTLYSKCISQNLETIDDLISAYEGDDVMSKDDLREFFDISEELIASGEWLKEITSDKRRFLKKVENESK